MAKPLSRPAPSSSVASMLDPAIGAHALSRPADPVASAPFVVVSAPTPLPRQSRQVPAGEATGVMRQFSLTPTADRTLRRILAAYSQASGVELKQSELLRAVLMAFEQAMPALIQAATTLKPLKRPKNERGTEFLRDALERELAAAILLGMRS